MMANDKAQEQLFFETATPGHRPPKHHACIRSPKLGREFEQALLQSLHEHQFQLNLYQAEGLDDGGGKCLWLKRLIWPNVYAALQLDCRRSLELLAKFCRLDLGALSAAAAAAAAANGGLSYGKRSRAPTISARLANWAAGSLHGLGLNWSSLLLLLFCYSLPMLLCNLFYQYQLDGNKVRLRRLRQLMEEREEEREEERGRLLAALNESSLGELEQRIELRIELAQGALERIGGPHRDWSLVAECLYVYLAQNVTLSYLLTPLLFELLGVPERCLDVINYFFDTRGQLRNEARLVRLELNELLKSSKWFTEARLYRITSLTGNTTPAGMLADASVRALLEQHWRLVALGRQLALEGKLQPLNRSTRAAARNQWQQDEQLQALAVGHTSSLLAMLAYMSFLINQLYTYLPKHYQIPPARFASLADYQLSCVLAFLALLSALAMTFQVSLVMLIVRDLSEAARRLNRLLAHCVLGIERRASALAELAGARRPTPSCAPAERPKLAQRRRRRLSSVRPAELAAGVAQLASASGRPLGEPAPLMAGAESPSCRLVAQLDEQLILALMHYRLFVAKFKRQRQLMGLFTALLLFLIISYPFIIRLHVKYFASSLKAYAFWVSAISSVPILLGVAPICKLNSRCLDSYRLLWSLLARLISLQAAASISSISSSISSGGGGEPNERARSRAPCLNIEHSISVLSKELSHSDQFSNQFACRAFGFKVSSSNLLRTIFWFWILVISILNETNTDKQGIFTSLLRDPLGFHTIA